MIAWMFSNVQNTSRVLIYSLAFGIVPMANDSEGKPAFRTLNRIFMFFVKPFGLNYAQSTFSIFMGDICRDLKYWSIISYLGDVELS